MNPNIDLAEKILIVDDNPRNIQLLGNLLTEQNYDVEYAQNGIEAIEIVSNEDFDLILMDVMMPDMDGYEACRRIKGMTQKSEIPIIFITAKTDIDSITLGFENGGVDYISKPFNTLELIARVKTHIALKQTRQDLVLKNNMLTDSITYAKRIQNALLPTRETLDEILPKHFLIYLPRDIVSGDFYWIKRIEDHILIVVADCTGHGVPGAFMSMLGMSIFNEIGSLSHLDPPNIILNQVRSKLKDSFSGSGDSGDAGDFMDGMDVSVCLIDNNSLEMQFAGAFSKVFLFRNDEIIVLKGDRQPIGNYHKETEFTNQHFQLLDKDRLYLFSDGFKDQFGGEKGKKYLDKNFRALLGRLQKYPMAEQKSKISEEFDQWKGDLPFTDDILLMGIEF